MSTSSNFKEFSLYFLQNSIILRLDCASLFLDALLHSCYNENKNERHLMEQTVSFHRSNQLLTRKMWQYLLPTMITMAALSLNEFLDSLVVSYLLGSKAMVIVNLGVPITMCITAVYTLLGNGAATLYAIHLGKRDTEEAGRFFTVAVIAGIAAGILFVLFGFLFFDQIAGIFCTDNSMLEDFRSYLRILLLSAPILIIVLTFVEFLTPCGAPAWGTAVNIVANAINIILDFVYIRVFHMGAEGSALATLTGYLLASTLILYVFRSKKVTIHHTRITCKDFHRLSEIAGLGSPAALSQFGFALKFAFCNNLAIVYGAASGIVCYTICNQTLSIVSIFLAAIAGASTSLIAVLHGQRDYCGEHALLKTALKYQFLVSFACFLLFAIFAPQIAALYSVTDAAETALVIHAVRIFSLMYLFRGFYMIFMKYLQVLGRIKYSMFISIFDGFAGIIPISAILCHFLGLNGLWISFPVCSLLLLILVLAANRQLAKRSKGALHGWLMAEREDTALDIFDVTILEDAQQISAASEQLMIFCMENGIEKRNAVLAALAIEEMAVYTRNKIAHNDYMDILARLYPEKIEIDFRSLGNSFNPLAAMPEDHAENIKLLQGISSSLTYDYIMGMNCTQIQILRKGAC